MWVVFERPRSHGRTIHPCHQAVLILGITWAILKLTVLIADQVRAKTRRQQSVTPRSRKR